MGETEPTDFGINPDVSRWVFLGLISLVGLGAGLSWALRSPSSPPPQEIASNPQLVAGRSVYLANCANCHGERGRGDGPLAKTLAGPAPRDFSDEWKYGRSEPEALKIVAKGAPNSTMPAWESALSPGDLKAVTAYALYLAGPPKK